MQKRFLLMLLSLFLAGTLAVAQTTNTLPGGELHRGFDEVRQTWKEFFASLQSIHGEIDHVKYLPAGDGVIAFGQVTYHRQLKGSNPEQRVVA